LGEVKEFGWIVEKLPEDLIYLLHYFDLGFVTIDLKYFDYFVN